MTYQINQIACAGEAGIATGTPDCRFDPAIAKGLLFTDKSKQFNPASATFAADLAESIYANGAERTYIVKNFVDIEDKSTEQESTTSDMGIMRLGKKGTYGLRIELDGSLCEQIQMYKLNGRKDLRVFLILDRENGKTKIFGTQSTITEGNIQGFRCQLVKVPQMKFAVGKDNAKYYMEVYFADSDELMTSPAFVDCNENLIETIQGLLPVTLKAVKSGSSTIDVVLTVGCSDENLFDAYGDELADVDAFLISHNGGHDWAPPDTVVKVESGKLFRIGAFTNTDTDCRIKLVTPAELVSLHIGEAPNAPLLGFESNSVSMA